MKETHAITISLGTIVMDCGKDQTETLSKFYSKLLGWKLSHSSDEGTRGKCHCFSKYGYVCKACMALEKGYKRAGDAF